MQSQKSDLKKQVDSGELEKQRKKGYCINQRVNFSLFCLLSAHFWIFFLCRVRNNFVAQGFKVGKLKLFTKIRHRILHCHWDRKILSTKHLGYSQSSVVEMSYLYSDRFFFCRQFQIVDRIRPTNQISHIWNVTEPSEVKDRWIGLRTKNSGNNLVKINWVIKR